MVMKTNIFRLLFMILFTSWDASGFGCYAENFSDAGVGNGVFWSINCNAGISSTHGCAFRFTNIWTREGYWRPFNRRYFTLRGRGLCGT